MRHLSARHHSFRRGAAFIDAGASDVSALDQGSLVACGSEGGDEWGAALARADDYCFEMLGAHVGDSWWRVAEVSELKKRVVEEAQAGCSKLDC